MNDEDQIKKAQRKWWQKKRYWLLGLVALSFAESFFVDYLVARQMENHVDFDVRYEVFLKHSDLVGSRVLEYEKKDWLGYTHVTYFSHLRGENFVSYIYQKPRRILSIGDFIDHGSDKAARLIVRAPKNGKIRKYKLK